MRRCARTTTALLGAALLLGCTPRETPAAPGRSELVVPPMGSASGAPAPAKPPVDEAARFLGRWGGVGRQSDGQTWAMSVRITGTTTGPCAVVDYPDLGCEGDWICLGPPEGGVLRAREDLTVGTDVCIDHGTVTMTPSAADGSLEWRWTTSTPAATPNLTARARLIRP